MEGHRLSLPFALATVHPQIGELCQCDLDRYNEGTRAETYDSGRLRMLDSVQFDTNGGNVLGQAFFSQQGAA
jgi:hypothetical protein